MSHIVDPKMKSWVNVDPESDFPIQNLPYGVFSYQGSQPRVGVAIGDLVLDLSVLQETELLDEPYVFHLPILNPFLHLGQKQWRAVRSRLVELLDESTPTLRDHQELREKALLPRKDVQLYLPIHIGAYVDFYSSEHHASNVGKMFRDPANPLLPNWKHLPVGYNGRASSVIVSEVPVTRPNGQYKLPVSEEPVFGPTRELDFELEMGFITGKGNKLGHPMCEAEVAESIFGLALVNDWSARDVQRWEYAPLGPFLAKTFATSMSPWVIPLDALEPWRIHGARQEPKPLDYLHVEEPWHFDIELEVSLKSPKMSLPQVISKTNFRTMYWSMAQQLLHQTINGTNVQPGDLYASGTISGPEAGSYGSMLELAWKGEKPIELVETGEKRAFLEDEDEVTFRAWCQGQGYRVGFGELKTQVLPALEIFEEAPMMASLLAEPMV